VSTDAPVEPEVTAQREVSARRLVAQARALALAAPRPEVPVQSEWNAGLGHLVRATPGFPDGLSRFLGPLDKVAEVRLTPDLIAFDGRDVPWQDVAEVRLAPVADLLSAALLDKELDRLAGVLPPVPGRKWAVRRITELVTGLVVAAIESVTPALDAGEPLVVTSSVVARGRLGRRRELAPGLFAAVLCTMIPEVTAAVRDAADRHGVPVIAPPPGLDARRIEDLAALAVAFRTKLRARSGDCPPDSS
jgi:hypothetical protein